MLSAIDGAACIIRYSSKGGGFQVTPLKLQKLLYYVQAWNIVFTGEPLFQEPFEAWIHGPVVPKVYRMYKYLGAGQIKGKSSDLPTLSDRQAEVVGVVLSTYGKKDARFLEELTHSEPPWINARQDLTPEDKSNNTISLMDMEVFYKRFIASDNPPSISERALVKRVKTESRRNRSAFLSGLGSVVDICPKSSGHAFYKPSDFEDELSDIDALASDWENVGSSIRIAMSDFDNN